MWGTPQQPSSIPEANEPWRISARRKGVQAFWLRQNLGAGGLCLAVQVK